MRVPPGIFLVFSSIAHRERDVKGGIARFLGRVHGRAGEGVKWGGCFQQNEEKLKKISKKDLTNGGRSDIILRLSQRDSTDP